MEITERGIDFSERWIVLDTETTGMDSKNDRIVEIGAVEMIGNRPTGNNYHVYINPSPKSVHPEALAVHGLSDEFLAKHEKFRKVYRGFLEYIGNSPLVIHNAPFDMGFLNEELRNVGQPNLSNRVFDSLKEARIKYPGQRTSLDALCSRLDVDNSNRELHGALIDSSLLADVVIKMMGLDRLAFDDHPREEAAVTDVAPGFLADFIARRPRQPRAPYAPSDVELRAHESFLSTYLKDSIWENMRQSC